MAKRKENNQNSVEPNQPHHFGLKEAYSVLQKDHLNLSSHCLSIQQQLLQMQNDYIVLEELYKELKQETDKHQENLVGKLQKSYDLYNEKCIEIETLQEQLEELKKLKYVPKQNEKEIPSKETQGTCVDDFDKPEMLEQRQTFENTVKKALDDVGLFLDDTEKEIGVNVIDYDKLGKFFQGEHSAISKSNFKKMNDLEESKIFLQKAMTSLTQQNENQEKEISIFRRDLQKQSEECTNLRKEIKALKRKNKNTNKKKDSVEINTTSKDKKDAKNIVATGCCSEKTVIIEHEVYQRIFAGLKEMCNFTVELKKTISNQNSWIDVLVSTLNENKTLKSQGQKRKGRSYGKSKTHPNQIRKDVVYDHGIGLKDHPLGSIPLTQDITVYENDPKAFCDSGLFCVKGTQPINDHSHCRSNGSGVASKKIFVQDRRPALQEQHGVRQAFELGEPVGLCSDSSTLFSIDDEKAGEKRSSGRKSDVCPMCDVIFGANYGLDEKQRHINKHFS